MGFRVQLVEERVDEAADEDIDVVIEQVWGTRYIDDPVLRRRRIVGGATTEWHHVTDAMFSTRAMLSSSATPRERIVYDAYGLARHHWHGDVDFDGDVDSADSTAVANAAAGSPGIGTANYKVECDLNRDGVVNLSDVLLVGGARSALPSGWISDPTGPDNTIGYDGYVFSAEVGHYCVRFRWYDEELGRWLERDPVGNTEGMNLYGYAGCTPGTLSDASGLAAESCAEQAMTFVYSPETYTLSRRLRAYDERGLFYYLLLSARDRARMRLFHETQSCILTAIEDCPLESMAADSLCDPGELRSRKRWLADTVYDFMKPYVVSLCEWAESNRNPASVADVGWSRFFSRLVNGEFDGAMGDALAAQAMALNHINNDLMNSLRTNGVGTDSMWSCIGKKVKECQRHNSSWYTNWGAAGASVLDSSFDVQRIRDDMRERVKEESCCQDDSSQ